MKKNILQNDHQWKTNALLLGRDGVMDKLGFGSISTFQGGLEDTSLGLWLV